MSGLRPWEGEAKCGVPSKNSGLCGNFVIDGLGACLQHVPDELLEEAEDVTGISRCRKRFGEPDACRNLAVAGTDPPQCNNHGANIGSLSRQQGTARVVEGRMATHLAEIMANNGAYLLNPPPIADPLNELLDLAGEVGALKEVLRVMAAQLFSENKVRYAHSKAGEQLRVEILLYERAVERFAKILIDISKLRIEDRLAGVQQQTADMMERALDAALAESGVGLDGINGARKAFRRHLKVVQGELVGG